MASTSASVLKSTPVLFVDQVEPCAAFWRERFGFHATIEVPGKSGLAYVQLEAGTVEIMYQSHESLAAESAELQAAARAGKAFLYVEVPDIQSALAACSGLPLVKPLNDTFYGAREFTLRDPGGHLVTFAQQGAAA